MAGALQGIRVIDFGQYIAGPLAAMLLSDQGAEVIRVEIPGGPQMDTVANRVWNRGKKSIVLDLKNKTDLEIAQKLTLTADVVIENFRPGVMDRLGLGAKSLTEVNPRLIYCSMPGFASDDPRASLPAWEGVLSAATASAGRSALEIPASNGSKFRPVYSAIPTHSSFAAMLSAVSIIMALIARERDGVGQIIEVPLFDATFTALGFRAQKIQYAGRDEDMPEDIRAAMAQPGFQRGGVSLAGTHLCKDGRWVYVHSGNKNARDFIRATGADRFAGEENIPEKIKQLFLTRTAQEWEDLGDRVQTEVVACRTAREWIRSVQPRESSMVVEVPDTVYGSMLQPGLQVHLSKTEGEIRPTHAPNADRMEILTELQNRMITDSPQTISKALAVLEGKKVLDLCIVLAGPTCGRTLAEFGANVIKIERPPALDHEGVRKLPRATPHSFNIDVNRGKRSLVIDFKSKDGIDVFKHLVKEADVVVENFRLGISDKLGFGYEQIKKINPNIVYASLNMYGYNGPWAGRPGHEQLSQHGTGMAVRYGGNGEPLLQHTGALTDYGSGLMGAYAVALALFHKAQTGEGQWVWSSLAHTGQILQSHYFYDFAGRGPWNEPSGQEVWGEGPLQRFYCAKDAWVFLGARANQKQTLALVEGLKGFPTEGSDNEIVSFLEEYLGTEDAQTWSNRLLEINVGIHVLTRLEDLMDDPWVRDHQLIVSMNYKNIGVVDQAGPPPRLSRTPVQVGNPAPSTGADGRDILTEHGLDADVLHVSGAVVVD